MVYIKFKWKFYKEIDIDKLNKSSLIEMIKEAKEQTPEVIVKEVYRGEKNGIYPNIPTNPRWWLRLDCADNNAASVSITQSH